MFEKIALAEENLAANLDPRPHIVAALRAIATRVEALGQEATGETGVKVNELSDRLDSLTSAVTSLGTSLTALGSTVAALGSLTKADGTVVSLGERLATLEAKASAPAVPPAPPQQ